MLAEVDQLAAQIDRTERADRLALESGIAAVTHAARPDQAARFLPFDNERERTLSARLASGATLRDLGQADQDYVAESLARDKRIMRAMALGAVSNLSAEDQAHYAGRFGQFRAAGNEASNSAGGYTVAPLFEAELLVAMKAFGGMRTVARVITTDTGATLPWPTMDDSANVATILGTENTSVGTGTDLAFGQTSLGAFTYVSGALPVSVQLLQDSVFDFDSLVRNAIAVRFARKQNADFTTGAGTTLPFGVVSRAASGKVGLTGQTLSVIYDDLVDLFHSVDPAYRANARFMMHDSSVQVVRKLKDSQGHPLWQPSLTAGAPDTLIGVPVVVNQQMAVMGVNAKSILFGDFSNYIIRDTLGLQMMVLRERYADLLQVAWIAYMRSDGNLVSAASPIKYYQNSAT
jgi:HK97 family phage major capsid protein